MVDVTDVPEAALFDEVELFGEHLPVEELAAKLGTINYELVCMVNKRVPRLYRFRPNFVEPSYRISPAFLILFK